MNDHISKIKIWKIDFHSLQNIAQRFIQKKIEEGGGRGQNTRKEAHKKSNTVPYIKTRFVSDHSHSILYYFEIDYLPLSNLYLMLINLKKC